MFRPGCVGSAHSEFSVASPLFSFQMILSLLPSMMFRIDPNGWLRRHPTAGVGSHRISSGQE